MASPSLRCGHLLVLSLGLVMSHVASASIDTESLLAQGNCAGAIPGLEQSLATDHVNAPYYLALCLQRQGDRENRVRNLLAEAAANGNHRAEYLLGLLSAGNNPAEAERHFEKALDGGNLLAARRLEAPPATPPERRLAPGSVIAALKSKVSVTGEYDEEQVILYAIHAGELDVARELVSLRHANLSEPTLQRLAALAIARNMEGLARQIVGWLPPADRVMKVANFDSLLLLAIRTKSAELTRHLAAKGVNGHPGLYEEAIAYAFDQGDPSILVALSLDGTASAARHAYLQNLVGAGMAGSLFTLAATSGDDALLHTLLQDNLENLWLDDNGRSPAEHLYLRGHRDLLLNYLDGEPPPQVVERMLTFAMAANDSDLLEPLLKLVPAATSRLEWTSLRQSLFTDDEVARRLIELLPGVGNQQDEKGRNLLMQAFRYRNPVTARLLLEITDVKRRDIRDQHNRSLAWYATTYGNSALVVLLNQSGLAVTVSDDAGFTPLLQAARLGQETMLDTLLALGAEINAQSAEGNTALMLAAAGYPGIVDKLINAGADLRLRNGGSNTALMIAVDEQCVECAQFLLKAGANPRRKNARGISAIDMATSARMRALLN